MKVCSIEGCESRVMSRGWCSKHYQRWSKYGDPTAMAQRPKKGPTPHGTATGHNNHGCRCEPCKEWHRTYAREWARANPEKRRATRLKFLYGIPVEQYDRMFAEQGGRCAICQVPPAEGQHLFVDHCHASTDVRALLCRGCNAGIGMLGDSPDRLMAAAAYLLQFTDVLKETV